MLEVIPTSLGLKNVNEQAIVWEEYRNTIDSINVDWSKIIQTRLMNISEHIEEQRRYIEELKEKHPKFYDFAKQTIDNLQNEYQEKGKRDRKYFIILKIDAEEYHALESNFNVDNPFVGAVASNIGKSNKLNDDELYNLAITELDNAQNLLIAGLQRCGIIARPCNKLEVLDYINNTINRDLAQIQSIDLMNKAGVFNFVPVSQTVDLFLAKEIILDVMKKEEIDLQNDFLYEDEENESEINAAKTEAAAGGVN
ncbi:hypothetical protein [Thermotalea metallivorans]|uniref:Uncharacterized protein n=1 Tax=Thermotalea metallivorans TaxID=520762 RepID=A0A140KZJ3_9FIRM|nr:hypothetical protein [Thermotalea metallivorans]KXG73718.1 hypothetical protein AN619_29500 [Thermotalea metallivorans]